MFRAMFVSCIKLAYNGLGIVWTKRCLSATSNCLPHVFKSFPMRFGSNHGQFLDSLHMFQASRPAVFDCDDRCV